MKLVVQEVPRSQQNHSEFLLLKERKGLTADILTERLRAKLLGISTNAEED